jgi:protein gp37
VPDEFIAQVFAVMAASPRHTYQCLTKRHARMRALLRSPSFKHQVAQAIDALRVDMEYSANEVWRPIPQFEQYEASTDGRIRRDGKLLSPIMNPQTGRYTVSLWRNNVPKTMTVHRLVLLAHDPDGQFDGAEVRHRNGKKIDNRRVNLRWGTRSENQLEKVRHGARGGPQRITAEAAQRIRVARAEGRTQQAIADEFGISRPLVSMIESGKVWAEPDLTWPLRNVHLGVSAETQKWAVTRTKALADTPAAVRFLSLEPLLAPIDLDTVPGIDKVDWVIIGGESGTGARPCELGWIETLVEQCDDLGIAVFVKQLGSVLARQTGAGGKGGDPERWPRRFPREFPGPGRRKIRVAKTVGGVL